MSEQNKALVRRMFELFNANDIEAIGEICAEDYAYHGPGVSTTGLTALQDRMRMYKGGFSDATLTIAEQIAEGDKVVTRARASGSNDGELEGIPPSGNTVDLGLISIHRVENGKLVEEWELFEELQMLQAMGAIPAAEEAAI